MAKKAMQRRPRFSTTEYREDFEDLIKTNPQLAAKSASQLAGKKVRADNQVADADNATREMVAFFGSTLVMGAAGWWMGSLKARRDVLIADWEAEGAESVGASLTEDKVPWDHERGVSNPMKWWFFPKVMVLPIGTGIAAMIAASMRKSGQAAGGFERTMTMSSIGTFGLTIAGLVGEWSYTRKEKALEKVADINSVKPAASNPHQVAA